MTFALQILSVAAPENEFAFVSHEPAWWQAWLPIIMLGIWFAICGFATWFVAGKLLKRRTTGWLTFAVSASIPLFLFLSIYTGVSIASGASSVLEIISGVTRFSTEAFIVLASMVWVGCIAATIRTFRHTKSEEKDKRESLDSFK